MAKGTRKPKTSTGNTKSRKGDGRLTAQQEAFCREYVMNGFNGAQAYGKAYPKAAGKSAKHRSEYARKLLKLSTVRAGVAEYSELMAQAAKDLAENGGDPATAEITQAERERVTFRLDANRVLEELATIAFADPRRLYKWGTQQVPMINKKTGVTLTGPDDQPLYQHIPFMDVTPSDHLTEDDIRTVAGVEMEISKTGDMVLKIKRADKLRALTLLGTHLKLFTNKVEHTGKVETGPVNLVVSSSEEGV